MARTSTARIIDHIGALDFPADKTALLEAARENNAPEEVLNEIRDLPDQEFLGPQDIQAGAAQR